MTCLQKWRADEIHTMPAAIHFRTFCHPDWILKTLSVKCTELQYCLLFHVVLKYLAFRTEFFGTQRRNIWRSEPNFSGHRDEISGVPNRIFRDTETELFQTHKTGTNGIRIAGRFPIRNPVGTLSDCDFSWFPTVREGNIRDITLN